MVSDLRQGQLYKDYNVVNEYHIEPGVFVLPVAEAEPADPVELANWSPVVVVQAFAPARYRKAVFAVEKSRRPPVLPAPDDTGSSVFVGGDLTFGSPRFNLTSQDWDWSAAGEYNFVESARHAYTDGFVIGGLPLPLQTQVDAASAYPAAQLYVGAVAAAGRDARIGVTQGNDINLNDPAWNYTCCSLFPGQLFSTDVLNGAVYDVI